MILAILEQGGGCDYTIGCGIRVEVLNANTLKDARQELRDSIMAGEYSEVESINIYVVSDSQSFNIESVREEMKAAKAAAREKKELAKKKALYEELKKEFDGE
jgi:spore coat polysaccharide biosynthesis protein SpsF (cytidylyltransferase family)